MLLPAAAPTASKGLGTGPDRLRREAFGVCRIPALCESSARREAKAPEYGALQTLRAIWLRLGRTLDPARRDALPRQQSGASSQSHRAGAQTVQSLSSPQQRRTAGRI